MHLNRTKDKKLRQFGIILGAILLFIGTVHLLKGKGNTYPRFYFSALMSFIAVIVFPKSLLPIYILFTKIGTSIGWVNTRLLLALIYYLIFTPIAITLRLLNKDLLDLKTYRLKDTYWLKRLKFNKDTHYYERQF